MCELRTYLASYKRLYKCSSYASGVPEGISVTILPRIVLHAYMIKLKALLVVRRIVSWQILCMDKCVCVVHLFYTRLHKWFNAISVFCTHVSHGCAV